ncbi:ABC transporter substrate-binding protein [Rugosimonospora acidiphila]|uniref:ABC transporter substrate-binding protein n=1 Tax=Rugosimonospora acidiphila TaxID=556531 RepID=A0ABP9SQ27_9ACTN
MPLVALTSYPHTRPLVDGAVRPEGLDLEFDPLVNGIFPAFRVMARTLRYDVSEFGISTALCAVERGLPVRLLPVFVTRRYDHVGMFVREDSPVRSVADLAGARIAVKSFTVTDVVWSTGILLESLGRLNGITWQVTGDEHLAEQKLPDSARAVEGSPTQLLRAGEVDAIFDPRAGGEPGIRPLFPDVREAERNWLATKGYVPPHHTIVVRESLLERYPDCGRRLYEAFRAAKEPFLHDFAGGVDVLAGDDSPTGPRHDYGVEKTEDLVGRDPVPYGLTANWRALEDIVGYLKHMGLLSGARPVEEFFVPVDGDAG